MKITTTLYAIIFAVTLLTLAPSLIAISPADAASHYCRDQKGKSQSWIDGRLYRLFEWFRPIQIIKIVVDLHIKQSSLNV